MLSAKGTKMNNPDVAGWAYGSGAATDLVRPSSRTQKLLDQYRGWKLTLGYEACYWWTKTHRETEGEAAGLRRAKALKAVAENVSLYIQPLELIVGVFERQPRCISPTPDVECDGAWLLGELDGLSNRFPDPFQVDEKTKNKCMEDLQYWKGRDLRSLYDKAIEETAPETLKIYGHGIGGPNVESFSHMHLGYDTLIQKGISGLIKDVEEKRAALDIGDPGFVKKMCFFNSCRIVCDAYRIFAERYAAHADRLATEEKDEVIRSGYQKAGAVCRNIALEPAKTLHEALQMIWFAQVLAIIESGLPPFGFGRMDQYLYPYYAQDIRAGIITPEQGQELLDNFWIKTAESTYLREKGMNRYLAGQPVGQQLNIGGVDEDGQDATNELSYMMIQATMNTRLIQPSLGVLWHKDMPDALARKAVELTSLGTGHPSHYSSDTMIRMLKNLGLTEKEARQGCMVGCVEPSGKQGTSLNHNSAGGINLALVVDLIFTNGISRMSTERIGMQTGDPRSFGSFEKVVAAFETQMYFAQKLFALWANTSSKANENFPLPFESLLMPHCIETGVDLVDGGALYNFPPAATIIGIADFIDSMVAVKYLIFDKKRITWDQLLHALDTNFEDMETDPSGPEIRQMCLSAPKYGNDDDYADEMAMDLMRIIPALMERFSKESKNSIRPGIVPVSSYVPAGLAVGALPSGRKAWERLADGCSPKQGMDRQGPTAVIRSLTRWCHDGYTNGTQFNMKFSPSTLKDQAGLKKFADLIKVFTKSGGHHVQFNVVSADVLKEAQSHPEKYPGLMVRVAGYSAYFIDLDVDVQNDIISRTELSL